MNPLVSGSIIAFERYIGNGVWQWYTMAIDGTNENDLGIAASYGGTIVNGALLTTNTTGKYVEVDLQTKKQTALAGDQLKAPTSTANDMITLSDGRVAFTYKQDENSLGANDTIAIVDITKNKTVTLQKSTSGLFETALLDNK